MGKGCVGGGWLWSTKASAGRPHLMSLKKNYSQLIIMLILFLGLSDLGYSTQLEGGYSDFSRGGDGNLLLQFI